MAEARPERSIRGTFFVIVGPSGVGKNSLIERAVAAEPGLAFVPSITTRPMRPGERDGGSYHFVTPEDFERRLAAGQVLEWQEFFAHRYGTSRLHIEARLAQGGDAITDVEVLGAYEILARLPLEACTIGIEPPSLEVLERRIAGRHRESEAQLELRRRRAAAELALLAGLDYIVVNDELETAAAELAAIVLAHRCRRRLEARVLATGRRPIFRTIEFELRGEGLPPLPPSRLGPHERSRDALARSLALAELRGDPGGDPESLRIEEEIEHTLERSEPFPYLELRRLCRVRAR